MAPVDFEDEDGYDADLDLADELAARWLSLVCAVGMALIAVVAVEVLAAILQGLAERASKMEPNGVATDLFHRIGFPFTNLGPLAGLFLVVGLVLLCVPGLLGQETSTFQDRLIRISLVTVIVVGAVLAIGSVLAVRYLLNEYTARGSSAPPFTRVGFAAFLITTLGTVAVAVFGALAALSVRRRLPQP